MLKSVVTLVCAMFFVGIANAQTDAVRVSGEITKITRSANTFTFKDANTGRADKYIVRPGTKIIKNDKTATFLDLRVGDIMTVYYRQTDEGRVLVSTDAQPAAPAPVSEPLPEALPQTASNRLLWPAAGLLSLFLAFGIMLYRRT